MKTILFSLIFLLGGSHLSAQALFAPKNSSEHKHTSTHLHNHNHSHNHNHNHSEHPTFQQLEKPVNIAFIKNLNQFNEVVEYKAFLGGINTVFLQQKAFTYSFALPKDVERLHHLGHGVGPDAPLRMHAYRVHFKNAKEVSFVENGKHETYHNYYKGNDPSKWASKVPLFEEVVYSGLYEGIDLKAYSQDARFKYDFIVKPGIDPGQIQLEYEGVDAMEIDDGQLLLYTSVGAVVEQRPYVYQIINGNKKEVEAEYILEGNTISFVFPNGFDASAELVIDPTVVASTLSGMTGGSYAFGHSATFDNEGNIFAGGRAFGPGFPSSTGAYQISFAGGETDIAVSKFNPTGTTQIYATYIGGSLADFPHSMIADFNSQLLIFGSTYSIDYPVTSNAFQDSKGLNADIIVTKLNADGTALVGSTYVGGSGVDGENISTLNDNYDDRYRGEIVLDNQGNAYIASCTTSDNFPVTQGAYDQDLNMTGVSSPVQDAVVFKMNSDLSTMFWATYLGGDDADTGYGLRVDDFGNVYVTGIAGGENFPTTPGTVQSNWPGGLESGYVTVLNSTGSAVIASTFWGSGGSEHSYFIDIDEDNNVHIYGQTTGTMPITPNTYFFNAGSRQFLAAFTNDLSGLVYSTVIGNGPNVSVYDFVPVAFMVDKCNGIYFSGYYASWGLPTTADAISNTGGTVYLGVLEPLATALEFGTYYGAADHVDGGTSRFDKSGTVYQGVCSCTSSGILNTLPGAFSENQSTFCDIGVFKIDFDVPTVTAAGVAIPAASGCAPFEVDLFYTGQDATVFEWHFDDGSPFSNQQDVVHTFEDAGTYEVMLVASNTLTCNSSDTTFIIIDVLDASSTLTDTLICNDSETIFLDATTINATYTWQDGSTNATYTANGPGVYWVDVDLLNGACTRRDSFILFLNNSLEVELGEDFSVCDESSTSLDATTVGASSYEWNNGSTDPQITITNTGTYVVSVYDSDGCAISDEIEVIFSTTPEFDLGPDTILCDLYTVTLDPMQDNAEYIWQDGSTNSTFIVEDPGTYYVEVNNQGCFASDTINVDYYAEVFLETSFENINCFDECNGNIDISISGGNGPLNFLWNTGDVVPSLDDLCAGIYTLTITDDICNYVLEDFNIIEPLPLDYEVQVVDVPCPGDGTGQIQILNVTGGTPPYLYSFNGSPYSENASLTNISGGNYEFEMIDANGCILGETILVYEPPTITVSAGPDQEIELGESVDIDGLVFPLNNQIISWSPSDSLSCITCVDPIANPSNTTTYTITVVDSITGCTIRDEMVVEVIKNRNVFIPNVFTPDGDGTNDIFTIFTGNGVRRIIDFKIFNRWGALVYDAENIYPGNHTFGWDGFFRGKEMNNAVFAYYAEVEFLDNEVILYEGSVTLVK